MIIIIIVFPFPIFWFFFLFCQLFGFLPDTQMKFLKNKTNFYFFSTFVLAVPGGADGPLCYIRSLPSHVICVVDRTDGIDFRAEALNFFFFLCVCVEQ